MTENIELDPNHPWVEAAIAGGQPQPVPASFKIEAITLSGPDGEEQPAGLLTAITPVGVINLFIFPDVLPNVYHQLIEVMQFVQEHESNKAPKLIVASESDMRVAGHVDAAQRAHEKRLREGRS